MFQISFQKRKRKNNNNNNGYVQRKIIDQKFFFFLNIFPLSLSFSSLTSDLFLPPTDHMRQFSFFLSTKNICLFAGWIMTNWHADLTNKDQTFFSSSMLLWMNVIFGCPNSENWILTPWDSQSGISPAPYITREDGWKFARVEALRARSHCFKQRWSSITADQNGLIESSPIKTVVIYLLKTLVDNTPLPATTLPLLDFDQNLSETLQITWNF